MAKKSEFEYKAYISIDGAEPILWESMTPEQAADVRRRMSERLSRSMSDYYSLHPEEYRRYCKRKDTDSCGQVERVQARV